MLNIKTITVNPIGENCYIAWDDTLEAIVIDCGAYTDAEKQYIVNFVAQNQLKVTHLLCTHGHFDHVWGADFIHKTFGVGPELNDKDEQMYLHLGDMLTAFMGMHYEGEVAPIRAFINAGDAIHFGTHTLQVIASPGHTPGGVAFYCPCEKVLFSGDSLFHCSIGRTDLPGGDGPTLIHSLKQNIMEALPDDVTVYPGHGETTTVGYEKKNNPYIF